MDKVAVILSAARNANRVFIVGATVMGSAARVEMDKTSLLESFATAGLRPGDDSGFRLVYMGAVGVETHAVLAVAERGRRAE